MYREIHAGWVCHRSSGTRGQSIVGGTASSSARLFVGAGVEADRGCPFEVPDRARLSRLFVNDLDMAKAARRVPSPAGERVAGGAENDASAGRSLKVALLRPGSWQAGPGDRRGSLFVRGRRTLQLRHAVLARSAANAARLRSGEKQTGVAASPEEGCPWRRRLR